MAAAGCQCSLKLLLWQVLTAKRLELLKALWGAGPISIREAARRVGRDVEAVHSDITALLQSGVLDRAEGGGVVLPFEAVEIEFLLEAAYRLRKHDTAPSLTGLVIG